MVDNPGREGQPLLDATSAALCRPALCTPPPSEALPGCIDQRWISFQRVRRSQSLQLDGKPFGVKAGKYMSAASRLRTPFLSILPPRAATNTRKSTMARTATALLCLLAAAVGVQACSSVYFAQEEHLQAHHRSLLAVRRPGRGAGGCRSGQLGAAGGGVTTISARSECRRPTLPPCAGGWRLELQEQRC